MLLEVKGLSRYFGNLHAVEEPRRLDEVLERLDQLVDENDHYEFFWVPHTGWALTKTNNRTDRPLAPRLTGWSPRSEGPSTSTTSPSAKGSEGGRSSAPTPSRTRRAACNAAGGTWS